MNPPLLARILTPGALRVLFQPVVETRALGDRVHYLEGLCRGPAGSTLETAPVLFDYVRLCRAEAEVDRACSRSVCAAVRELPHQPSFAINVHATTLAGDPGFASFLDDCLSEHRIRPERLLLEIVEHAPHLADARLRGAVSSLRSRGVRLALDDVGVGHSNFAMMLDLDPGYLKLDRYVVQGCSADRRRRAVVESVALLARRLGALVVAEGVEDPDDLLSLRALGVALTQGYLFGRPVPASELGLDPRLQHPPATEDVTSPAAEGSGHEISWVDPIEWRA